MSVAPRTRRSNASAPRSIGPRIEITATPSSLERTGEARVGEFGVFVEERPCGGHHGTESLGFDEPGLFLEKRAVHAREGVSIRGGNRNQTAKDDLFMVQANQNLVLKEVWRCCKPYLK